MRALAMMVAALALASAPRAARADGSDDDCDGCSERDWILAEPGVGPEVGPLARLELGTAGLGLDGADDAGGGGGHALTAGLARVRLAVPLGRGLGVRASATVQALAPHRAPFPFAFGADAGGALALGVTRELARMCGSGLPIAATVDGELATGPAVRSGLGLRTFADGARVTVAPGLATAADFYVGTVRAHARYLRTRGAATGDDVSAVEVGLGASMRINWGRDFWGGSWPLEAWADVRHRRGLGAAGDARELEVRGGLDYTGGGWLDRLGVEVAGTGDRTAGGTAVRGLAMLVTLQYGVGARGR